MEAGIPLGVLIVVAIPSTTPILLLIRIAGMLPGGNGLPKSRNTDRDRQSPLPLAVLIPDIAMIALGPFGSTIPIPVISKVYRSEVGKGKEKKIT